MTKYFTITLFSLTLICCNLLAQEQLPLGANQPAIEFKYFPNRVYAVIWRNWNLVDPARIAKTIGCSGKDVNAIAASIGLPPAEKIPPDYKRRMYITILRRNWHSLPYDQLLTLLDMSSDKLASSLSEDDFLFVKLGYLKPECPQLIYSPPDEKALERAGEIKQLVQKYFQKALTRPAEPRFSFVKQLSSVDNLPTSSVIQKPGEKGLRFIYSYFSVFGDPLIDTSLDPYPSGLLSRLAAEGVNGVWMHVVLNQLAPGGKDFPEFGAGHEQRIANLQKIVTRAKKYGIQVYLYMNEPRAMPTAFFKNRPDMAGVRENNFVAMCTSNEQVRDWLSNSLTYVFKQIPDLGGVFTITASENLTNCASHGQHSNCSLCNKRSYADIISGVNKTITDGVHRGNPNAKVIVWDWGWNDAYTPDIIAKLPKSDWFMSVSEWAKPFARGGVQSDVGEYSMSVVGPGPRATQNWSLAKASGLKTVAKVQFSNTWELSAVPWLPVLYLVAEHPANLNKVDLDGYMLSWTLGGYPSPNLEIAQIFAQNPHTEPDAVLNALALKHYGKNAAPFAVKAWTAFSKAFQQFPYHIGVVYYGSQQLGPANLLFAKPTGYAATMVGFPYDDLNAWRSNYPAEVFAMQFEKVTQGWKKGLDFFDKVAPLSDTEKKGAAHGDWRIAKAAYLHFASVANQIRFIMDRDSLLKNNLTEIEKRVLKKQINVILDSEINLAVELFEITRGDSRIGFEASNQYYYVPHDLMEKVIDCEFVRKKLLQ